MGEGGKRGNLETGQGNKDRDRSIVLQDIQYE